MVWTILTSLNAFPVDRENPGPSTLKRPVNLLKENKTVGIFPTGHRTSAEGAPLKERFNHCNVRQSANFTSSLCWT